MSGASRERAVIAPQEAAAQAEPVRIGRYELLAELGKGGMGVVYRAFDPKIGREVALKTILTGVTPKSENYKELRRRLEREARAAGALNHPNIVTVYDVGEWESSFYITMEYVAGRPLDKIVKGGDPLPLDRVCVAVGEVARALDYAHSKKVIHRDIKPANLILSDEGPVKIADFGIARLAQGSITHEGGRVGSPSYMSPEQIEGGEIDGRTDFFSLGVVFYQLLTGRKPFRGKNIPAITHAICHNDPEPPSMYNSNLPRRIERIVLKLLSKNPAERHQNGEELCADLAVLEGIDLNAIPIDYGAAPAQQQTRERTPLPPSQAERIRSVFRNITSDARTFSVGDRSGPGRRGTRTMRGKASPRRDLAPLLVLGAATLLSAGAALWWWLG